MSNLNRITYDPEVMQGQARIKGANTPVSHIVLLLSNGKSEDEIVGLYPGLEPEDIRQSLKYAARLSREAAYGKGQVVDPVGGHVEISPAVAGGKPRIAGRRITVQNIAVWHERLGMEPREIATEYDLTLADVFAALAYYFDHREAIDRDIQDDDAFNEALENASPEERPRLLTGGEWRGR